MKARCLAIGCIATALLLSGCFKSKQKACISSNATWYYRDTLAVNDSVYFTLCNWFAPAGTTCTWDFGDGNIAYGTSVHHVYTTAGNFIVRLTVYNDGIPDLDTMMITIMSASGPDYAGTFHAAKGCFTDSLTYPSYISTITSSGPNNITIHNMLNTGTDVDATVNGFKVTIPTQVFGSDTVTGDGKLSNTRNFLSLYYTVVNGTTGHWCSLGLTRQ